MNKQVDIVEALKRTMASLVVSVAPELDARRRGVGIPAREPSDADRCASSWLNFAGHSCRRYFSRECWTGRRAATPPAALLAHARVFRVCWVVDPSIFSLVCAPGGKSNCGRGSLVANLPIVFICGWGYLVAFSRRLVARQGRW